MNTVSGGVWPLEKMTAVKQSCCLFALFKMHFLYFHLLPFNNTHILCLLSDVTSYTDSVASHSQSGYPNRKVHVFLFLNWCTNLEKKTSHNEAKSLIG